ncbi:MAG: hypothetical protein Fur0024_3310 [Patescibacteria group bacterium]
MKTLKYTFASLFLIGVISALFLINQNNDSKNKNIYQKYVYSKSDLKIIDEQKNLISMGTEASCSMGFLVNTENMVNNADLVLIVRPKQHFLEATHFSTEETGTDGVSYIK